MRAHFLGQALQVRVPNKRLRACDRAPGLCYLACLLREALASGAPPPLLNYGGLSGSFEEDDAWVDLAENMAGYA